MQDLRGYASIERSWNCLIWSVESKQSSLAVLIVLRLKARHNTAKNSRGSRARKDSKLLNEPKKS